MHRNAENFRLTILVNGDLNEDLFEYSVFTKHYLLKIQF